MKHLALIMDGNRRWARANKLSALMGHDNGANTLKDIVRAVAEQGIPFQRICFFNRELAAVSRGGFWTSSAYAEIFDERNPVAWR